MGISNPKDVKYSGHTSFTVRMVELKLHASFEFHTALYHVDIVRARVYVLDSSFQIPESGIRLLRTWRCATPFIGPHPKNIEV